MTMENKRAKRIDGKLFMWVDNQWIMMGNDGNPRPATSQELKKISDPNSGEMSYQKAEKIRKSSFGSLLAEQEGGLGESFKKAVSLKTRAKVKGIKETFDPMNIAKFMTGGSNWAPAMLGKLRGRSKEDIARFSGGKVRDVGGDTASKLGPLEQSNEMMDVLMKIYTFMQKTHEEDIKQREETNQFAEENKSEKDRRHKDLIEALTGKRPEDTAEKVKKETGMETPDILTSILDSFGGAKAALSLLKSVGTFFMGPVGLAFLGAASIGAIFYMMSQASPEAHAEASKVSGAADVSSEGAAIMNVVRDTTDIERRKQNILAERPSSKKSMLFWKDPILQEKYLKEIGWDESTGLTQEEKQAGFVGVNEKGVPVKADEMAKSMPAASTSAAPSTSSAAPSSAPSSSTAVASTSSAEPVSSTPPAGAQLEAVQSKNNDLNIPESKQDPSTIVSNIINSSRSKTQPKVGIPLVRNQEETFQRMLFNSTRVV